MKTVFFYYDSAQKAAYWRDSSIIFFDNQGWWIRENNKRDLIPMDFLDPEGLKNSSVDVKKVIADLRSWGPIWGRWHGKGDRYEELLREAALLVIKFVTIIKRYKITTCLMHTGVSHHIDSIIFEMACNIASVRMIFLYCEVISARLLPMMQEGSIESREPLGHSVSEFNYREELKEFLTAKIKNFSPKHNITIGKKEISFLRSIPHLLYQDFKQFLGIRRDPGTILFSGESYPFQYITQAFKQREGLQYLQTRSRPANIFVPLLNKPSNAIKLILAAHYQPEATSFPEGGNYGHHVDISLEIYRKGYLGPLIYKEHPASLLYLEGNVPTRVGMYRSKLYYQQLEEAGCQFIDMNYQLSLNPEVNAWYVPVTITGTIAIERALAGFSTIVTGYPWFKDMPGVIHLSTLDNLLEIPREWTIPSKEIAENAFAFLEKVLNGRTLCNMPGIGTGKPLTSSQDINNYIKELGALLTHMTESRTPEKILNK